LGAKYIWYESKLNAIEVYAKSTPRILRTIQSLKIHLAKTVLRIYTSREY